MADRLTQVAEVLAAHRDWIVSKAAEGPRIVCEGGDLDYGDARIEQFDLEERIAAHQADMLRAAGLVPETATEWGVQHPDDLDMAEPWVNPAPDEQTARASARQHGQHLPVMRREVSAWRPADKGSEA